MIQGPAAILKRLERDWRALWIRTLTRLMRRGTPWPPPGWGARPHRVLFLRHDRIGDMILSTGLLRVIATSHPTIRLDVLASPTNAPVLLEDPHVQSVVVFDRTKLKSYVATLRGLRAANYDAVIDCMPTAPSLTTLLLIWASGARHRIGVARRGNDDAFTLLVPPREQATHIVDQLGALAAAFGVDPQTADFTPRLHLTEAERGRAIASWGDRGANGEGRRLLVNVSSGRAFRRWPDDRFVGAIRHVVGRDPTLAVVVIGAPDERDRTAGIAREAGVRFVPTASLRDALALVATTDLVFTPDTGLAHAASAFGRPAVVMHIHGTALQWGPYGSPGAAISSPDGTLTSLPLASVLTELDRLVGDPSQARPDKIPGARAARIGHFVR